MLALRLLFGGVFDRFPQLKWGAIELGAAWVPGWMRAMDSAAHAFRRNETRLQKLSALPSEIVRRHESLRTTFTAGADAQVAQVIHPPQPVAVALYDLRGLAAAERPTEVQRLLAEQSQRPFDLAQGPLLRAQLFQLAPEEHILLMTFHHIAVDGWAIHLFFGELTALYGAYSKGAPSPLSALPIQYADFSRWQRQQLQGAQRHRVNGVDFHTGTLQGTPVVLFLSGMRNYDMAVAMSDYTPNLKFADALAQTGTPTLLGSLTQLELYAKGSDWALSGRPGEMLEAALSGFKSSRIAAEVAKAHVIVGTFHELKEVGHAKNLAGKTVITSAVDDERLAIERLGRLLGQTGRVQVVGSSTDPADALGAIALAAPDVLFLDIQMEGMTGLSLARQLDPDTLPCIVFVTAYDHYALEAFEVSATDSKGKPADAIAGASS